LTLYQGNSILSAVLEGEIMLRRQPVSIDLKRNLIGYYIAIGIILAGYVFLAIGDANSFSSRTLGPVVIVIGYIIAMPAALLFNASRIDKKTDAQEVKKSESTPSSKKSR
jgi:hypothetical protein